MKSSTKLLLGGLLLGPLTLTSAWAILGFFNTGYDLWDIHVAPYSVIAQPISGLGLGNTAPFMNTAFVLSGIFIILGAIGFGQALRGKLAAYRTKAGVMLSLVGVGAAICGLFTLESFMLHTLGFLFALSPILTFPYLGAKLRKDSRWRAAGNTMWSAVPILLVTAVAYFASFNPEQAGLNEGYAGLTERILLVALMSYYAVLGFLAIGSKDQR